MAVHRSNYTARQYKEEVDTLSSLLGEDIPGAKQLYQQLVNPLNITQIDHPLLQTSFANLQRASEILEEDKAGIRTLRDRFQPRAQNTLSCSKIAGVALIAVGAGLTPISWALAGAFGLGGLVTIGCTTQRKAPEIQQLEPAVDQPPPAPPIGERNQYQMQLRVLIDAREVIFRALRQNNHIVFTTPNGIIGVFQEARGLNEFLLKFGIKESQTETFLNLWTIFPTSPEARIEQFSAMLNGEHTEAFQQMLSQMALRADREIQRRTPRAGGRRRFKESTEDIVIAGRDQFRAREEDFHVIRIPGNGNERINIYRHVIDMLLTGNFAPRNVLFLQRARFDIGLDRPRAIQQLDEIAVTFRFRAILNYLREHNGAHHARLMEYLEELQIPY